MVLLKQVSKPRVSFYVALILGTLAQSAAMAGPKGGTVVHGDATITTEGTTTTVTNTPGAIINWEQFSVAPDEITRFVQQNASSTVLNRVTGTQGSEILGQILSNGRVFLINPNGIAIGAGARINTGGFVASSLNISDADFLSGREAFSGSGAEGRVVNRGTIETSHGASVYLIAPNVENHGVIRAPGGEILLAAGHSAELVSAASPNLRVRISAPEGGEAINVGELVAQAGRIGLFGAVVRASGRLDASSASVNEHGEIVLSAAGDAYVDPGAQLLATNSAGVGGSVLVEGARVAVLDEATIDVSGATGGGGVRLGGDYLGGNADVRNASATVIAPTATVRADALESGNGGRVIVWSDDYTGFHGDISARGGASGGNGGFVETSSRGNLQALGAVDASAAAGTAGEWLLDPYNITISVAASSNGAFGGGNPNVFTPTGNSAIASRDSIQTSLNAGTSVTVATGGTGSPGTQAGTITVNAPITKTAGGDATLSLLAQSTITFNAGADITSTSGALGLTLTSAAGAITNLRNLNLNGGTLTLTASSGTASTQAAGAVISGNTSIVKAGTSQFRLQSGQTYTGSTTINGGSLVLLGANVLPDSTDVVIASGASLNLNGFADSIGSVAGAGGVALGAGTLTTGLNNTNTTLSGVISGSGSLVKEGTGTFTLSGNNNYTGATTINAGTLQLGAANRIANNSLVTVNAAGTFDLNGFAETLGVLTGSGAVTLGAGTLIVGSGNVSSTFNGVISGTGGFTKSGTGTFTMGGANTYTGTTSITGGTLTLAASERIADASAVTLSGGTTLNVNGFAETLGSLAGSGTVALGAGSLTSGGNNTNTTYSGVITGTGGVTKIGTGIFTLSGVNTFSGALNVNAGTLAFTAANRLTGNNAVTIASGAVVSLANNSQSFGSLAGAGNVTLGSGTLTAGANNTSTSYSGVISGTGGFTKAGTGRITLFGANTYTGATTVNGGALRLAASERLSNSSALTVAAGALFELDSYSETLASIAGAGTIDLGNAPAGTLATAGTASTTFSGVLTGDGALTKGGTGTLTLSGNNNYAGATLVNAGTLVAAHANALGGTTNGTSVTSGATLRISNAAVGNEAVTINGLGVSSAGALTGDGTASIAGPVTMASASRLGTTNAASTLALNGTLDGAFALTTAGTGTIALNGIVGGTSALVSITQGATTPMRIGTSSVTTTGLQNWAGPLTLDADTTLRSTGSGAITLANVTGNGNDVTVNTAGLTTVRNVSGVDTLVTDAPGTATIGGAGFTMLANNVTINEAAPSVCGTVGGGSGAISFAGAVALCADTTINGTTVNFASTVNSSTSTARALTINASGATDFRGVVGATNALASLTTNAGGSTRFHAGATHTVRTTGAQTYNDAVELVATVAGQTRTFTSTGSGAIAFNGALDASGTASNLVANTAGVTTFAGAIGATSALNAITTDAAGSLALSAPLIRTIGNQTYNDATATHSGATSFVTTSGNLVFTGAVNSTGTLNFNLGGGSNDATLANAANDLNVVSVTSARNVTVRDATGLIVGLSALTGSLSLTAGGAINQTGAIVAPSLTAVTRNDLGAAINLTNAANDVDTLTLRALNGAGLAPASGVAQFTDADGLSLLGIETTSSSFVGAGGTLNVDGNVTAGSVILRSADDIVLGAGRSISASAAGTPLVLDAADRFVNNGAAVTAGAGRWVIYSANPANNVFGGLASGNAPVWGNTYGTLPAGSVPAGNRYVFATGQTLTFTSTDVSKIYGDDATAAVAGAWTVSGYNTNTYGGAFLADSAATTFTGTPGVTSLGSAPTAPVAGSPYAIDITTGSLVATTGYTLVFNSAGEVTVDPRALLVAADDVTKVYGDADPLLTYVATGLVNADTLSGALTRAPGETVAGGPYAITQGTLDNPNYVITFTPGELTITPRGITVVANDATKIYGDVDPLLTYVATGLVGSDTLSGSLTRDPGETVAGGPYAITQGTLANSNYTISFTPGEFTITPRGITVVADDATKVYGDVDPLLTYVATGLLGSDTLSGALTRDPGETVAGGPYAITQGTLANSNYTIAFAAGEFTITPRGITVVADDATKVYGDVDPLLTYVATGLLGSDTLSGSLIRNPGETVAGGPYAITQGTLANSNYSIAFTPGEFTITPRGITVVADDATKVYGDVDPLLTYVATGLLGSDSLSGSLTRDPGESVAGSPYAITQGTLANSNYAITFTNGEFTITPRPITVVANDGTKVYGDVDPLLTYVATGLVGSDTLSGALVRAPGETVAGGPYAITQGTLANSNYAITFTGAQFTITPRGITVVANDATKIYGEVDPLLTYVATGLVGSDALSGSLARDPGETVAGGPYAITQGSLANSNYAITFTGAQFTITPRGITVVANDATKVYGNADPILTYTATGLINGDMLFGALTRAPGETVAGGPYAITQGTLANSNYAITFTNGVFTITPRPITVVANDATKVYGDVDPLLTYVATGLLGSDTLAGSLARDAGENVAGSPYAIRQGTLANSNYAITFTNGDFSITRRPITVTADDQVKTMGLPDPAFTWTATNMVAGDTLAGVLSRVPGETAAGSPYAILQGTVDDASNPNYAISYVPGELTITPSPIALDNRPLQVAIERAKTNPFPPVCLPQLENDRLGKEFAKAQERLDRAGKRENAVFRLQCLRASR